MASWAEVLPEYSLARAMLSAEAAFAARLPHQDKSSLAAAVLATDLPCYAAWKAVAALGLPDCCLQAPWTGLAQELAAYSQGQYLSARAAAEIGPADLPAAGSAAPLPAG
jgi:hypothetical protein